MKEATLMPEVANVPWHGTGVWVDPAASLVDKLTSAGLNWGIDRRPLYFKIKEETGWLPSEQVDTHMALVRSDNHKLLSVVTGGWTSMPNLEAFGVFDRFCNEANLPIVAMGEMDDSKITWALAKVPDTSFEVDVEDVVDNYLLFSNPHEYGKSISLRLLPVRNKTYSTMNFPIAMPDTLRKQSFIDTALIMHDVKNQITFYKAAASTLSEHTANDPLKKVYLAKLFPNESVNKRGDLSKPAQGILKIFENGEDKSWWSLFNAVTYATDHLLGHSQESRLKAAWYGFNRDRKIKALDTALFYASEE